MNREPLKKTNQNIGIRGGFMHNVPEKVLTVLVWHITRAVAHFYNYKYI